MTIIKAIQEILSLNSDGLTAVEIHKEIVDKGLYEFGAKDPVHVVNGMLRKHCISLDFPTASPVKYFSVTGKKGKALLFALSEKACIQTDNIKSIKLHGDYDKLPEEKILDVFNEHISQIEQQLLDKIRSSHPSFFEQLVVDLLLKMGYGYDKNSGHVVGQPYDKGIDGIITQDSLGLDLIYIQAKRYKDGNGVGSKDIQAFVGAMLNVEKGVFITTSKYTKQAKQYASRAPKNIKLIDGQMLVKYMIEFGVGVESVKSFSIYRVNTDYFDI